jgi:hypothetical protein
MNVCRAEKRELVADRSENLYVMPLSEIGNP